MKRIALLVLVLAAGCNNQKPEERKLPGAAAPVTPAPTAPGSGSAGSGSAGSGSAGSGAVTPGVAAPGSAGSGAAAADARTGFAPFDEALAGTRPWIAADDKAGVVELHAVDDLSGKTKGRFSVELRCGADAAKAVETVAKQIPERARSGHEPPKCKEDAAVTSCRQPGLAEGDFHLELQYAKVGDAWRVIGVKTTGVGVTAAKEEAKYAELLKQKCK